MMKQFTELQRYELQAYLQAGIKKDEIAHKLGVHRSSLYRELRRNKWNPSDVYDAAYAQYRYELRKEQRVHSNIWKLELRPCLFNLIIALCVPLSIEVPAAVNIAICLK